MVRLIAELYFILFYFLGFIEEQLIHNIINFSVHNDSQTLKVINSFIVIIKH